MSNAPLDEMPDHARPAGQMRIEEDDPGQRLRLVWNGSPPRAWLRLGVPLAALAVLLFIESRMQELVVDAWQAGGPNQWGERLMIGLIVGGAILFAWQAARGWGSIVAYWSEMTWDRAEQQYEARRRGWLFWGHRRVGVSLDRVTRVRLEMAEERRGPLAMRLTCKFLDARGNLDQLEIPFTLDESDTRAAGRDVLFSIGRILGASGYIELESGLRREAIQLELPNAPKEPSLFDDVDDEEEDDEDSETDAAAQAQFDEDDDDDDDDDDDELEVDVRPIPGRHAAAHSPAADVASTSTAALKPVDRAALEAEIEFTKLRDWRPGERVQFVRPAAPRAVYVVVLIFGALAGGAIGAWPLRGFLSIFVSESQLPQWAVAVIAGAGVAAFLYFWAKNHFQERETVFDWRSRRITIRKGEWTIERPFEQIRAVCSLDKGHLSNHDSDSYRDDGCRLELSLVDRDVLLIETEKSEKRKSNPRDLIEPVGKGLAASLGVSFTRERVSTLGKIELLQSLRFSLGQTAVLAAIAMIGAAGLARGIVADNTQDRALAAIRQAGVEVIRMSSFSLRNDVVAKDYWNVQFKPPAPVDRLLADVKEPLADFPSLGIDADQTSLSNAGLTQISGLQNLRVFKASETQITDAGLPDLGRCSNLVYVNLHGSPVGDDQIGGLNGLARLRFLYLGFTHVTDAGLAKLDNLPALEYLHVSSPLVTADGVNDFRRRFPAVRVECFGLKFD